MIATRLHKKSAFILLISTSVLTGCVNLEAVGKFANGTQLLSEASGKFYDLELESDRKLAVMTVDLGEKQKSAMCKKTEGIYLTPWECATKGENLMSEARRNRAAVATLAQYAQSLNEIAEFNDDANVEKASKELSGKLNAFAKTLNASADPKESVLANAISGLAKIYIDLKVRQIIYEKAKLAQNDVSTIVTMLKDDIARQQQRLAISRLNADATREEWFNVLREKYEINQSLISQKRTAKPEKTALKLENDNLTIAAGALVENTLIDKLAEQPNAVFLNGLNETANSCLEAHKALQDPDLNDKAGIIIKFIHDARSLLSTAKRLGN